jgi:hypothetical protein
MDKQILIKEVKNSGFIFEAEKPEDYILGATSPLNAPPVVFNDGHGWPEYRAKAEMQFNRKFDSFSCTCYATLKAMVAYLHKVYGVETTMSEMFNAFYAGVIPNRGTSIRNAMEAPRKNGWIEDKDYPFTSETTQAQFFKKPPQSIILKAKGKLSEWDVRWEQLDFSGNLSHAKIKEALKMSPVVCSGFAWASYYGEGVYYDYNNQPNHAFLIDDWSDHKDYDLIAFDSYPQDNLYDENSENIEFEKKLAKNFRVWSAHRIWLTPKKKDYFITLKFMKNLVGYSDNHGLHFYFVKERNGVENKQEIPVNEMTLSEKALYIDMLESGNIKTTSWAKLQPMPSFKFF